MVMDKQYLRHAVSCLVLFFPALARGEALTDGTMGPIRNLSGQFEVPQNLGTLKGQNLFHSFQKFHVRSGESATFTGDNGIRNVISRVTGSEASEINGKLSSQIGKADFYFINPNGVVFGQGAQIDVPAAFRVSTASEIRFPDGGVFSAADPNASTLSVEKPEAYGFLGDQSGHIRMALGNRNPSSTPFVERAASVDLVGRELSATDSEVKLPGGSIRLESVGEGDTQMPVEAPSETSSRGSLTLTSSTFDVSGKGGGKIDVRAGSLKMPGVSRISGDTYGSQNGAPIDVRVQGDLTMSGGSQISSSAFSSGNAGDVLVETETLTIDGEKAPKTSERRLAAFTGIRSNAGEDTGADVAVTQPSTGNAGRVAVNVKGNLSLKAGGQISSSTYAKGKANRVTVNAGTLTVDGRMAEDVSTGILSESRKPDSGDADAVTVNVAGELRLVAGGRISSSTFSGGAGGEVTVRSRALTIDGQRLTGNNPFTGIRSHVGRGASKKGPRSGAGPVTVTVTDQLSLLRGGQISSSTLSSGKANRVTVSAGALTVDGQGFQDETTGILSEAREKSSGDAGAVAVNVADPLSLAAGGRISSSTFSGVSGKAGDVKVSAGTLAIDAQKLTGNNPFTGIRSEARESTNAGAGLVEAIEVNVADELSIFGGGRISSKVFGTGKARDIKITADQLRLDQSSITTEANDGDGGRIDIGSRHLIYLKSSEMTTSAVKGNGGDIDIKGKVLVMETGFIQANAEQGVSGGDIHIDVDALIPSGGTPPIGRGLPWPLPFEPDRFGHNVIQAAAPYGVSGNIDVTPAQLDLSGTIAAISAPPIDFGELTLDFCGLSAGSSLIGSGLSGGLPPKLGEGSFNLMGRGKSNASP